MRSCLLRQEIDNVRMINQLDNSGYVLLLQVDAISQGTQSHDFDLVHSALKRHKAFAARDVGI